MPRIEFVFFDAGGGHRSAATSLKLAVRSANLPWEIHLMNLQEVLDRLDILRRFTGLRIQDFYNKMLESGWTLGSAQLLRVLQLTIAAYHRPCVNMLADSGANPIRIWSFHSSTFQSRAKRKPAARSSRPPVRHDPHRSCQLSAALLDRETETGFYLRNGARARASSRRWPFA